MPAVRFDFRQQPVAHVEQQPRGDEHCGTLERVTFTGGDVKQQLDGERGEPTRHDGQRRSPRDLAPPLGRAGLTEERHQRADDENRLEAFAQQQQERLPEHGRGRALIRDQPLGTLQVRQQARVDRGELRR